MPRSCMSAVDRWLADEDRRHALLIDADASAAAGYGSNMIHIQSINHSLILCSSYHSVSNIFSFSTNPSTTCPPERRSASQPAAAAEPPTRKTKGSNREEETPPTHPPPMVGTSIMPHPKRPPKSHGRHPVHLNWIPSF